MKHSTGLSIKIDKNLDGKKKLFIHLSGNSQAVVLTQNGALTFADFLEDVSFKIRNGWADEVENG